MRRIVLLGLVAIAPAIAACGPPENTFHIANACGEDVAVWLGPAGSGGTGFKILEPDGTMAWRLPQDLAAIGFAANSDLPSGSPELSYIEFDLVDLVRDGSGEYHLLVNSECEAVAA